MQPFFSSAKLSFRKEMLPFSSNLWYTEEKPMKKWVFFSKSFRKQAGFSFAEKWIFIHVYSGQYRR